jgi:predicted ATPase
LTFAFLLPSPGFTITLESLRRLYNHAKRPENHEAALQLLAEIYGWFTEGFDTKDLQEAKALLEELT